MRVFLSIGVFLLASSCLLNAAPVSGDVVLVQCETTKGTIKIDVYPEWAPLGAARFLELVKTGFFSNVGLTRVVKGFLVQFGIAANPTVQHEWNRKGNIQDDPNIGTPVKRGTMAYAGSGINSRSTQIWISFQPSRSLGTQPWETPFAQVHEESMEVVDAWYSGYGDMEAFGGHGPDQGKQQQQGSTYLKNFPDLDYITSCAIVPTSLEGFGLSPHTPAARHRHGGKPHEAMV
mmetsp:Transcript_39332/g.85551  ORF Transcript_39332/g.85551 Transcript_39332/m.85551 type:complete len:233 (-) Transcript_39332:466-1164(-)|eukprot:CAMPEP_0118935408 /NCGR_PEP_ID=MMETSP1169-20130426/15627_1 /TAXON_ID=36882 /ORGANISM="Pyramimonas obovata, Strain CCMP722" /LENGTH=232 /DNA_ID=CAMNT_0006878447 /DNA_START=152 /DNA_END=850 /DNA_ORIENTATION=-